MKPGLPLRRLRTSSYPGLLLLHQRGESCFREKFDQGPALTMFLSGPFRPEQVASCSNTFD